MSVEGWQIEPTARRSGVPVPNLAVRFGEALVALVLLTSFYVRSEQGADQPTPYDILMALTVALLFLFGLKFPRGLGWPAALWGLVIIGYGIGAMGALYLDKARPAMIVSIYLIGTFLFFSSFIYADVTRRLGIVLWAYTAAACVAAGLGVGGYFHLLPGSEMFLVFGRATGTFNDPNVFGPFLVAPILFLAMKLSTAQRLRSLWMLLPLGLLTLGVLLSFSRGAWGNLVISAAVFIVLTLATSRSSRQTFRLIGFSALMALVLTVVIGVALSSPRVSVLFEQRAALTQDYDVDPEHGRFESQARAFSFVLQKPWGIGPAQWAMINNLDTHNVYLHVLVAGGFLSGLAFIAFVSVTVARGWRAASAPGPQQGMLIVVYAALVGHFFEGVIIDIDSWRHLYLLLGMFWGAMLAAEGQKRGGEPGEAPVAGQGWR
ncbi:MAG: O-antigen ligase family protein [Afipia sp.]|nr:O-antigen ligase family protein [Afipia sp.]